jgi:hypothetical protein
MTRPRAHLDAPLAGVAVLTLAAAPPAIPAATSQPARTPLQRELNTVVAAGATSATAQVVDGRHRVHASSGIAELDLPRPAPANGRFRAGSATKAFVGTVVLQLVAEHRLGLDGTGIIRRHRTCGPPAWGQGRRRSRLLDLVLHHPPRPQARHRFGQPGKPGSR